MSNDVANKAKPKAGFFHNISRFFKDLKSEAKKVVWPSKKQVKNNTAVVLTFMAVAFVVILALDIVFLKAVELVF